MATNAASEPSTARSGGLAGAILDRASDALLGRIARQATLDLLAQWRIGRITVHLPEGDVLTAGPPDAEQHATLRIRNAAFFRKLALHGPLWIGESYMDGDWWADDLARFIELAIRNQNGLSGPAWLSQLGNLPNTLRHRTRPNTRTGARRNIRAHYDLSNDLFALFLDETMAYSSAIFEQPEQSLRDAQANKFAMLARKLRLGPTDHVLEIGCGWGGFAIFAAATYGCRVTGITLSEEQQRLAAERVRSAGLQSLIDIQLSDYREVGGSFTKIVSIEMLEAVGQEYWGEFFGTCDRHLAAGGLMGLQVITVADRDFAAHAGQSHWVQKYIFPGALLPSLLELSRAMSDASQFGVYRLEDIGQHYATTLERWRTAFNSQLGRVRGLGFDERFIRMWDFYLAACQARFETRTQHALQLVLARPGARSRSYQAAIGRTSTHFPSRPLRMIASMTRILATASSSGVRTGVLSMMAREKASPWSVY